MRAGGPGGDPDDSEDSEASGDAGGISTAEKVAMAVSVAFTVTLFGVAVWYALTGPGVAAPTASVAGSQPVPGGVGYTVVLWNQGDVGLVSATVEVECTDPPTEVTFENVPAGGRRTGMVVCPPGTTDPAASVSTWIPE